MDFNIHFSPTLVVQSPSNLNLGTGLYNHAGVWVDAVYFPSGIAKFTNLVANGYAASASATLFISSITAGKIYLIVWSGLSTSEDPIQALITQESDLSIQSAETNGYRFDSVELTVSGSPNDVANLTSVVGFGLPMQLSNSNGSVGYQNASGGAGNSIFKQIQNIIPASASLVFTFSEGPLSGTYRYGVSPASASQVVAPPFPAGTTPPFLPTDWADFIKQFQSTTGPVLALAGFFNGAPDANGIWHNQGFYSYQLSYDGTAFWLSPASNSQIQGFIKLTPAQMENSIYATNANVEVYTAKTDGWPYTIFNPGTESPVSTMNVGANNQWGDVLKELFTGFTAGFWGGSGTSPNTLDKSPVNLNQNWNWDPTYAFNQNGNAQTYYDKYSEVFFKCSNSYGSGYSDNLMALYQTGGPLLSLDNGAGGDVAELNLTLYADSDPVAGYTVPQIDNYIPPPASGEYAVPPFTSANAINMTFNFCLPAAIAGDTTWMLDQAGATISLQVLTDYNADGPTWTPINFEAGASGAKGSLWWEWTISKTGSTYTATPGSGTAQSAGNMVITGMPVATDGLTWYLVSIGNGIVTKMFNLYLTTATDANQHPQGFGWSMTPAQQAIDGGGTIAMATLTPPQVTVNALTVNFLAGASTFIEPSMLAMGPQPGGSGASAIPMLGTPSYPIAGTGFSYPIGGVYFFTAFPGQTSTQPKATSSISAVMFAWTGLAGPAALPTYNAAGELLGPGWISTYTNKISALNVALIRISGSAIQTQTTATADIDGQWMAGPVLLENGTYTVTMQEFLPGDAAFQNPVGQQSAPLMLTVSASPLSP